MGKRYEPLGPERHHDLSVGLQAEQGPRGGRGAPLRAGGSFREYLDSLPNQLAVRTLRDGGAGRARGPAEREAGPGRMGAHVIKVGLSPILIDLLERGAVTAVAASTAALRRARLWSWPGRGGPPKMWRRSSPRASSAWPRRPAAW